MAALVGVVACMAAAAAPAGAGTSAAHAGAAATSPVPQGFVGVMADGPLFPGTSLGVNLSSQFDKMVASGVETVRAVFDWAYAEPYATWKKVPAGVKDQFTNVDGVPIRFNQMDEIVAEAASHGMTVLPVVLYTPPWDASPHPPQDFAIPRSDAPYARFLTALVHRYGPNGSFFRTQPPAVPIRMWQIWNEPNITTYWPQHPYQQRYVKLLRISHNAIKAVDPGAKIVLAGLPNFSWTQMQRIYKIKGAAKLFDVVAVHPYTRRPSGVITIIQKVRQVMDANGDAHKPIVADEISWPSSIGKTTHNVGFDFATTEAGQAQNLATLLPLLGRDRKRLGLLGFYYYTWAGAEQPNALAFSFSGLLRYNATNNTFVPKPALASFAHAALALEGCAQKGSVATSCVRR
jgi:hypothetical protein